MTATEKPTYATSDMQILVVGHDNRSWGKGDTLTKALDNAKAAAGSRPKQYVAYIVAPDTRVNDMGDITYPLPHTPKEFHRVGFKPAKKAAGVK